MENLNYHYIEGVTNNVVDEEKALSIAFALLDKVNEGFVGFESAESLANRYILANPDKTRDEIVDSLIKWESSKSFGIGFVTGLGGFITALGSIPASITANLLLQIRLCSAISLIYGEDIQTEEMKTFLLVSAVSSSLFNTVGITTINKELVRNIPRILFRTLQKELASKLVKILGAKVASRIALYGVPVLGGFINGTFESYFLYQIGINHKNRITN
jgi:hypothetical protein